MNSIRTVLIIALIFFASIGILMWLNLDDVAKPAKPLIEQWNHQLDSILKHRLDSLTQHPEWDNVERGVSSDPVQTDEWQMWITGEGDTIWE